MPWSRRVAVVALLALSLLLGRQVALSALHVAPALGDVKIVVISDCEAAGLASAAFDFVPPTAVLGAFLTLILASAVAVLSRTTWQPATSAPPPRIAS